MKGFWDILDATWGKALESVGPTSPPDPTTLAIEDARPEILAIEDGDPNGADGRNSFEHEPVAVDPYLESSIPSNGEHTGVHDVDATGDEVDDVDDTGPNHALSCLQPQAGIEKGRVEPVPTSITMAGAAPKLSEPDPAAIEKLKLLSVLRSGS